jgi:predicted AAA+ superfamily ATPase
MKPGDLDVALRKTNLWWRKPHGWESDDRDLRRAADAPYRHEARLLSDIVPGGLYIMSGPRRVGKSVEVKRAISRLIAGGVDPRRIIHASCEGWLASDLGALVDRGRRIATRGVREPRFWFLDEITAVKGDWPNRIKWLRDNDPFGGDCVVLTGSSARGLGEATKALAGRRGGASKSNLILLPMGFKDFCRVIDIELPDTPQVRAKDFLRPETTVVIDELYPWSNELIDAWEIYLQTGGFPQAVEDFIRHGEVGPALVGSLWDVIQGEAIRSVQFSAGQTQSLLVQIVASMTTPLNFEGVARDLGATAATVARRVHELQEAFIVWPCHREEQGAPRLRARSKLYFTDPLLARLAHLRNPEAVRAPDLAKLSEQQIGLSLLRQREAAEPGSYTRFESVMYRRTATGGEIDFVGPWMGGVPFESKYVDGAWRREAQTARAAYDGAAVLATRSVVDRDGRAQAIPAPIVALMLEP